MKENKVLVISGPTGSGETTITKEIINKYPVFRRLITATTRKARGQEKNKVDYYFFNTAKFKQLIKKGDILEYTYIKNREVYYGTYLPELTKKISQGNVIVNVDHVGLKFYKEHYGAVSIFIKPESLAVLKLRLKKRNPEMSVSELKQRLKNAEDEIKREEKFYDYIVFNRQDKLEIAVAEIVKILKKEKYI